MRGWGVGVGGGSGGMSVRVDRDKVIAWCCHVATWTNFPQGLITC